MPVSEDGGGEVRAWGDTGNTARQTKWQKEPPPGGVELLDLCAPTPQVTGGGGRRNTTPRGCERHTRKGASGTPLRAAHPRRCERHTREGAIASHLAGSEGSRPKWRGTSGGGGKLVESHPDTLFFLWLLVFRYSCEEKSVPPRGIAQYPKVSTYNACETLSSATTCTQMLLAGGGWVGCLEGRGASRVQSHWGRASLSDTRPPPPSDTFYYVVTVGTRWRRVDRAKHSRQLRRNFAIPPHPPPLRTFCEPDQEPQRLRGSRTHKETMHASRHQEGA